MLSVSLSKSCPATDQICPQDWFIVPHTHTLTHYFAPQSIFKWKMEKTFQFHICTEIATNLNSIEFSRQAWASHSYLGTFPVIDLSLLTRKRRDVMFDMTLYHSAVRLVQSSPLGNYVLHVTLFACIAQFLRKNTFRLFFFAGLLSKGRPYFLLWLRKSIIPWKTVIIQCLHCKCDTINYVGNN